jgi:probable RNA-binding protein EIF1AD
MSGSKRRTGYRKHLQESVLNDFPIPSESEQIIQIVSSQGSNQLEVRTADGAVSLAILPTKFRRLVWVKRGDFLIASCSGEEYETAEGISGRVRFIVEHILYPEQVKYLQSSGHWPVEFLSCVGSDPEPGFPATAAAAATAGSGPGSDDAVDNELPAMWRNTNRRGLERPGSSSADSSDDER